MTAIRPVLIATACAKALCEVVRAAMVYAAMIAIKAMEGRARSFLADKTGGRALTQTRKGKVKC